MPPFGIESQGNVCRFGCYGKRSRASPKRISLSCLPGFLIQDSFRSLQDFA
jgi:hypothetical protein